VLIQYIQEKVAEFVLNSSLNTVKDFNNLQIWDQPLVGVASAEDNLWVRLKEPDAVGPQHLLPQEWLPGTASVISYFLPFTES
jgi:epoxyqueuosine reductase